MGIKFVVISSLRIKLIVVSVLFDIYRYVKHGGRFVKHASNVLHFVIGCGESWEVRGGDSLR